MDCVGPHVPNTFDDEGNTICSKAHASDIVVVGKWIMCVVIVSEFLKLILNNVT